MTVNPIPLSISLKPIQVDMVIDTDKAVLDELMELYKHTPKESWGSGVGITQYFEDMWTGLKDGYEYFLSNPTAVSHQNQGWIEFCKDCLRCAVLYSVMTGYDIELVDAAYKREWLETFLVKTKSPSGSELVQVCI